MNQRLFYACTAVGMAPNSTNSFVAVHGLRSVGITTKFNLEQVFEIGQLDIYANMENLPDIEVTAEKHLDGYPLLWHLSTQGATTGTLLGRSNQRCMLAMSLFSDLQYAASGNAFQQVTCSGLYPSSWTLDVKVEGEATESLTLVGNDKIWSIATTGTPVVFQGGFTGTDVPLAPEGVDRRQDFIMASSVFPLNIPGINGSGGNVLAADGNYTVKFQSVRITTNLGREMMLKLGQKGPFFRYVNFPVEVRTDFEIIDQQGELVNATEVGVVGNGNNLTPYHIYIQMKEGTKVDVGTQNMCSSVNFTGGNAQARGGNVHSTFSYISFNDLLVQHPQDPTVALAA